MTQHEPISDRAPDRSRPHQQAQDVVRSINEKFAAGDGLRTQPEAQWIQCEVPDLRIIDPDLAQRVDARREQCVAEIWKVRR